MFYICRVNPRATKSVSTQEGAFSSSLNLPRELAPISWSILRGGNSAREDVVSHEIVGTHGGALQSINQSFI